MFFGNKVQVEVAHMADAMLLEARFEFALESSLRSYRHIECVEYMRDL